MFRRGGKGKGIPFLPFFPNCHCSGGSGVLSKSIFTNLTKKIGHILGTEPFNKKLTFSGKFVESLPFYLRNALPSLSFPLFSPLVSFSRVLEAEGERAPSYSALETKVKSAQIYDQCFPKLVLLFPSADSLKREGSNERTEFGSAFFYLACLWLPI